MGSDAAYNRAFRVAKDLEDEYELECQEAAAVDLHAYAAEAYRYERLRDERYHEIAAAGAQHQKWLRSQDARESHAKLGRLSKELEQLLEEHEKAYEAEVPLLFGGLFCMGFRNNSE